MSQDVFLCNDYYKFTQNIKREFRKNYLTKKYTTAQFDVQKIVTFALNQH